MPALFSALFSFLASNVFGKALTVGVIYAVMAIVIPMAIDLVVPFLNLDGISQLSVTPLAGYVFYIFRIDFLLTVMVSAYVARFLIRRLPIIG